MKSTRAAQPFLHPTTSTSLLILQDYYSNTVAASITSSQLPLNLRHPPQQRRRQVRQCLSRLQVPVSKAARIVLLAAWNCNQCHLRIIDNNSLVWEDSLIDEKRSEVLGEERKKLVAFRIKIQPKLTYKFFS